MEESKSGMTWLGVLFFVVILLVLLGGGLGSIVGMQLFRHKTRHWYFVWGMPAIFFTELALAIRFMLK